MARKKPNDKLERWLLYEDEVDGFRGYLPDPDEVDERLELLRYLQGLGLHRRIIGSTMIHGTPTLEVLLRMVARHGVEETHRRLEPFIEETD